MTNLGDSIRGFFWDFRRPWWHGLACGCNNRKTHFIAPSASGKTLAATEQIKELAKDHPNVEVIEIPEDTNPWRPDLDWMDPF